MSYVTPNPVEMSARARRVLRGWLNLSEKERREMHDAIATLKEVDQPGKRQFRKRMAEMLETGPLRKPCPCCGH